MPGRASLRSRLSEDPSFRPNDPREFYQRLLIPFCKQNLCSRLLR